MSLLGLAFIAFCGYKLYKSFQMYQLEKDPNFYNITYYYNYSGDVKNAYNRIVAFANANRGKLQILKLKFYTGFEFFNFDSSSKIVLMYKSLDGKTTIDDSLLAGRY